MKIEIGAWDEPMLEAESPQALDELYEGFLWDDNGAECDGSTYVVPADHFESLEMVIALHTGAAELVFGDIIIGYDGSDAARAWMDARYPRGWAGYSSRNEAYGIVFRRSEMSKEEFQNFLRYMGRQ